jgi:tRNA nucleotidyltransferase (CCA-adding enzyme)
MEWMKVAEYPTPVSAVYDALAQAPAADAAYRALTRAGGTVYAVGGAVRDAFLGNPPKDVDLMVQGLPPEVVENALRTLPGRVDLTGKSFGVYRYRSVNDDEVEVALPRTDRSTGPEHTDFQVNVDHNMPVEQDLGRRDFTANAMALNLGTGELHDPYGGQKDIEQGTLRVISPQSFEDDPLRTVRALVANSRHGLQPDPETKKQMAAFAHRVKHLPGDRIQQELDKLFKTDNPRQALDLAAETGVLKRIFPEVDVTRGFDQKNPHHDHDLGTHLLNVLDHTSKINGDPDVRLAALLHDIGKPDTMWTDENGVGHFYEHPDYPGSADHAQVGADYAREAMKRLRYPNARTERVTHLITQHMFPEFNSLKGARKFLNRVGDSRHAFDLLDLREADLAGKGTKKELSKVETMRQLVREALVSNAPTDVRHLAIGGDDLIGMGLKPGPEFKRILQELTEMVLENPELNTRESLLAQVPYLIRHTSAVISGQGDADILDNGNAAVERWIANGITKPYRELPSEYQKAIAHYMAADGEAWQGPEGYYPERQDGSWVRPQTRDEHLPHFIEHYGDVPFGVTHVPLEELKQAVMHGTDMDKYPDWDSWHKWYGEQLDHTPVGGHMRGVPEDSQELWPIVLDRDYGDVLQDGWHRFHNYAARGIDPVPAFYYPR